MLSCHEQICRLGPEDEIRNDCHAIALFAELLSLLLALADALQINVKVQACANVETFRTAPSEMSISRMYHSKPAESATSLLHGLLTLAEKTRLDTSMLDSV